MITLLTTCVMGISPWCLYLLLPVVNTPEDLTVLPPSYARIDSDTGRFMYEEGEGDGTVFPGECSCP